jgi:hypothetical protein
MSRCVVTQYDRSPAVQETALRVDSAYLLPLLRPGLLRYPAERLPVALERAERLRFSAILTTLVLKIETRPIFIAVPGYERANKPASLPQLASPRQIRLRI